MAIYPQNVVNKCKTNGDSAIDIHSKYITPADPDNTNPVTWISYFVYLSTKSAL